MAKFLTLEEVAARLGVNPADVHRLREDAELNGYRDGASWKFKEEDVGRYLERRAQGGEEMLDFPLDVADDADSADMVVLSELELGESNPSTSSTVIGRNDSGAKASDSDIEIAELGPLVSDSDVSLVPDAPKKKSDSDVRVAPRKAGSDSIQLGNEGGDVEGATQLISGDDIPDLTPGSTYTPGLSDVGLGKDTKKKGSDISGLSLDSDALSLSMDDDLKLSDSDLSLADSNKPKAGAAKKAKFQVEPDEESVLEEGTSDVSRAGDSGIGLAMPSDSGISLEGPLGVGSDPSGKGSFIMDDGATTELTSEDDFLLTPLDDGGEDMTDSGSQVIALDADSDMGDSSATLLSGASAPSMTGMLEEESSGGLEVVEGDGDLPAGARPGPITGPAVAAAPVKTAPYTIWNVLGLTMCLVALMFSGMMMTELIQNMWNWNNVSERATPVMNWVVSLFEK